MDNGARVMEHALAIGNCQGMKPPDNVPASDSHKSDDRANPVAYADEQKSAINVVRTKR